MPSCRYLSPEIINFQFSTSYCVDIWSLGILTVELCFGANTFSDKQLSVIDSETIMQIFKTSCYSSDLVSFTLRCLERDPNKRGLASELIKESFLELDLPRKNRNNKIEVELSAMKAFCASCKMNDKNSHQFNKIRKLCLFR